MAGRPRVNSSAQQELDRAQEKFNSFDNQVKELTQDRMNEAPKIELEPQTKIATKDLDKSKDIYLKPIRAIGPGVNHKNGEKEKFNEKFREDYNFAKEYVHFTAENKEIIGEDIELWTKPFPGMNCEFWKVPTNKPIWGPRYLAERIAGCKYHRLKMDQNTITSNEGHTQFYGTMAVDNTIQRLDATPVSSHKSVFMGAKNF